MSIIIYFVQIFESAPTHPKDRRKHNKNIKLIKTNTIQGGGQTAVATECDRASNESATTEFADKACPDERYIGRPSLHTATLSGKTLPAVRARLPRAWGSKQNWTFAQPLEF